MGWLSDRIVRWQREHGRHDLPWQETRDPYRIWVSEIMLQQTQVAAVIRYYGRLIGRFPDLRALAGAPLDELMRHWSGLGYYGRARNLHACARQLVDAHGGRFPDNGADLAKLPGIGRSTGAAIAVFAFGAREPILDGNVKRVFCRVFAIEGDPASGPVERRLWEIAGAELPAAAIEDYTQGLMDLGATLCTRARPACERCPLRSRCLAHAQRRTSELPNARARRAIATRATTMLVLRSGDEILLERRPASGVWGGLWSLPELDADRVAADGSDALARFLADRGQREISRAELPSFEHAFTHFRLRVAPLLVRVAALRPRAARDAPGEVWIALTEVGAAALPSPVKSLLLRLREG